jgi:hypothetical protein
MARAGEREGDKGAKVFCPLLSQLVAPTGTKSPCPPLARLAVGPGTKATYCPGPKGCRDKWSGTKTYSVVVYGSTEHACPSAWQPSHSSQARNIRRFLIIKFHIKHLSVVVA